MTSLNLRSLIIIYSPVVFFLMQAGSILMVLSQQFDYDCAKFFGNSDVPIHLVVVQNLPNQENIQACFFVLEMHLQAFGSSDYGLSTYSQQQQQRHCLWVFSQVVGFYNLNNWVYVV